MSLPFILTTAGRNAIVNANNTGTNPVIIASVGVGDSASAHSIASTALNSEIKRITAVEGGATGDDTIHVTATDATTDVYTCREVGLFSSTGVLLAVYSQASPILQKESASSTFIAVDLVITGLPAGSISVGATNFTLAAATTLVAGVVPLATNAETIAGAVANKAVTPASLNARNATESVTGLARIASAGDVAAGTDDSRFLTIAKMLSRAASIFVAGVVRLANSTEIQNLTSSATAVSPSGLAASPVAAKAWVSFNSIGVANGANCSIIASRNVTSVIKNATGDYSIFFAAGMPSNYCFFGSAQAISGQNTAFVTQANGATRTAAELRIRIFDTSATLRDSAFANVVIFG